MKVLILFSHAWRGGKAGGAETHALQLIQALAARGHEMYFVAASGKRDTDALPPGAVAQYRLPFQSLNPLDKIKAARQLLEIVARHRIELVHAHHRTGGYFAEFICRRIGVPYIVTVHDIWHRALAKKFHGRIFRNLIAVSGFIQKGLVEKFGFAAEKIRVIRNGVAPERFEQARAEDAARFRAQFGLGDETVFSLVGRITVSKGHFDVLEALRLLPRTLPLKCLFVGEGKDRGKLERLVERYGLKEKVIFCGFQSDIPAVMRASDVILLPSHREPCAIAIPEAMFSQRPLLVSDSGGTPEAVTDGREGIVFPVRDAAALARGFETLTTDRALRLRMGEEAQRTAYRRFLLSGMIDETEAYYGDVIRAARR